MIARAMVLWLLIGGGEILLGLLRLRLLNPRVGDRRARQMGVGVGCIYIMIVTLAALPWVGVHSAAEAVAVGALWFILMLALDLGFGRLVFHFPWARIAADFDLRRGGLLGLGLLWLALAPLLAGVARGLF